MEFFFYLIKLVYGFEMASIVLKIQEGTIKVKWLRKEKQNDWKERPERKKLQIYLNFYEIIFKNKRN